MSPATWVVATATTLFHLATANSYGYHRDEFYYLASGRRLAWSYVDHPPLTPLLYRLSERFFGTSPFGLRVVAALLHGLLVVLVVMLTRELGGSARAQLLAALGAAVAPMFLTTGHFLGTVTVELSAWTAIVLLVVKLLNGSDHRLWVLVGVAVGIALLDKSTTVFLVVALVVGLLLFPQRSILATPWMLVGAAITVAMMTQTLLWQARRGWPQLEFAGTLRSYGDSLLAVPTQFVLLGGVSVLLALPGLLWLLRDPGAVRYRALGVAFLILLVVVMATGAKPYYAAVFAPVLVAAGGVAMADRTGWALPVMIVGFGVLLAPFALPLLPLRAADATRRLNPEIGEMIGWPHLVDVVADVYDRNPGATILASNYSEAGSIELLGAARGLPQPISGHNTYWYWGHPYGRSDTTIAVGFEREFLEARFGAVERAATFRAPHGVHNLEDGAAIWVCREQRESWEALWSGLRQI
ncbi:MAG: ArnT family glycosyltransferase [Acidimicrobiia bacterium]